MKEREKYKLYTSSSFSSKIPKRLSGISSFRPLRKCSTSFRTELASLCCASASK